MEKTAFFPLRIGSKDEFGQVVCSLRDTGFSESVIAARLDAKDLSEIDDSSFKRRVRSGCEEDPLGLWIRLFVLGEFVQQRKLEGAVQTSALAAFRALDLIRLDSETAAYFSPVRMVPVSLLQEPARELLIASDRTDNPDGSAFSTFSDLVFSGHNILTRQFIGMIPLTETGSVLDLCSGTGVGALTASFSAREVQAVDIAERSVHFARFNCALNGCERVAVLCGDLYQPVAGAAFDRIVSHPPYVPTFVERTIYRDGGETGDRIVRQIIQGIPAHLKSGGTFHLLCIGMDREGRTFEERVRAWLGEDQDQFDLVFAVQGMKSPEEFAHSLAEKAPGALPNDLERWVHLFATMEVKTVAYGTLVGRRGRSRDHEGAETFSGVETQTYTRRVQLGPATGFQNFDWLFRWFDWLRLPEKLNRVLSSTPRLNPEMKAEVTYSVQNQTLKPHEFYLTNAGQPFPTRVRTDDWIVSLVSLFDGARTSREIYNDLRSSGSLSADFLEPEFAELLCFLMEREFLILESVEV